MRVLVYSRAPRVRGAPLIRDFGKPISVRKFGLVLTSLRQPTDRPCVRTLLHVSQCEMRHLNPVLQPGLIFGGKLRGQLRCRPRLFGGKLHRQLRLRKKQKIILNWSRHFSILFSAASIEKAKTGHKINGLTCH